MEKYDYLIGITFGFAAAIWVCIFSLLIVKLFQRQPILKSAGSTIIPGVSWYVLTYGLLAFGGSSIHDYWGIPMLMTGIMIFIISIIGFLLKEKMPIMSKAIYFIMTIVLMSITMQLLWILMRG
jgi:hypothetical protein